LRRFTLVRNVWFWNFDSAESQTIPFTVIASQYYLLDQSPILHLWLEFGFYSIKLNGAITFSLGMFIGSLFSDQNTGNPSCYSTEGVELLPTYTQFLTLASAQVTSRLPGL
jgi:hypothetical protein